MQGEGGAHYEVQEPMGSDGGASWRENLFYFFKIILIHKLKWIDFTNLPTNPDVCVCVCVQFFQ